MMDVLKSNSWVLLKQQRFGIGPAPAAAADPVFERRRPQPLQGSPRQQQPEPCRRWHVRASMRWLLRSCATATATHGDWTGYSEKLVCATMHRRPAQSPACSAAFKAVPFKGARESASMRSMRSPGPACATTVLGQRARTSLVMRTSGEQRA
jgi:hypothetical protein